MRLTRTTASLAAGMMALAGAATAITMAATPASATAVQVVLVNCTGHGQVRPATYDIGCMPSQEFITGLTWTSWRSVAFGSGTLKVNNCNPSCAAGHYVRFPILTVLWRAQPWPGHLGKAYFSRLTWIFTGRRPAVVHTTAQTFTLPAS